MDWKVFATTFAVVFLAEMGDKTQLAALTLTSESRSPLTVFLGASLALVLATLLGVAVGSLIYQWFPAGLIKKAAGAAFLVIGALMLWGKL